jgi:glycosyltransferase involved in cell wall biosynthesis
MSPSAVNGPLRVLYSFPLRVGLPGIGVTAWNQVAGLTQLGVRVTLCCGSLERPIRGLHRLVETMRLGPLPVPYRLFGDDRSFRLHDWKVSREIGRRRYDVFHGWPGGSLRTLQTASRFGVASLLERPNTHTAFAYAEVAREHELLGLSIDPENSHAWHADRLTREEAEYAQADKLLCPSDFVARTFLDRGFAPDRIARHQYGYEPEKLRPSERAADAPFTVVFAGRCEPRKGLHYALQAWHESGAAGTGQFIICGSYMPGYREVLKPWLDHRSIEERGFVNDIGSVLSQADVLLLPSIEEGSALVTYEARGAGCVVLASDAAGGVGAHGDEVLLHRARDVASLAHQIGGLSRNPAELRRLRRRSLASIDRLHWAHAARTLLARYEETCVRNRASRENSRQDGGRW